MEDEPKKVWHYQVIKGLEYYCIARTKEEAIEKIKDKHGIYPIECWWKTFYKEKERWTGYYPKGTIF